MKTSAKTFYYQFRELSSPVVNGRAAFNDRPVS